MNAAIADLISVLQTIVGLTVTTQIQAAGSSGFTLAVGHGTLTTEYMFGAKKLHQVFELVLTSKGTENQPATVYAMNKAITDALEADRRRGGNAQTTIVGDWELTEDLGREGLTQTLSVEIQTYES